MVTIDPLVQHLAAACLGALMIAAAWHKLADIATFADVLRNYRLLPEAVVPVIAPGLAVVEAGVGVAAIIPGEPVRTIGLLATAAVLMLYAAAIATNLIRGHRFIDCGCLGFTALRPELVPAMVVRNLVLVALAVGAAVTQTSARPLVWVDWLSLAAGIGAFVLIFIAVEHLIALAASGRRLEA